MLKYKSSSPSTPRSIQSLEWCPGICIVNRPPDNSAVGGLLTTQRKSLPRSLKVPREQDSLKTGWVLCGSFGFLGFEPAVPRRHRMNQALGGRTLSGLLVYLFIHFVVVKYTEHEMHHHVEVCSSAALNTFPHCCATITTVRLQKLFTSPNQKSYQSPIHVPFAHARGHQQFLCMWVVSFLKPLLSQVEKARNS